MSPVTMRDCHLSLARLIDWSCSEPKARRFRKKKTPYGKFHAT